MIEHCLSVLLQEQEEKSYREYITDALMSIGKNTAKFNGGEYIENRWIDQFIEPDMRTGDEIAMDIIKGAGIKFKGGK